MQFKIGLLNRKNQKSEIMRFPSKSIGLVGIHRHHRSHPTLCRRLLEEQRAGFASVAAVKGEASTTSSSSDINKIAPSPLPTYYFQKSLPRLPIPKLELTCQRYLEALKPLITPEQLSRTEKLLSNFQNGVGNSEWDMLIYLRISILAINYMIVFMVKLYLFYCTTELHRELMQKDKVLKQTSYISGPWFEMYLKDRNPLPINTNPGLVFVEDDGIMIRLPKSKWQLTRTTNLLISSLR